MRDCFTTSKNEAMPIILVAVNQYSNWLTKQSASVKAWLTASLLRIEKNIYQLIPGDDGQVEQVICLTDDKPSLWDVAHLPLLLPKGSYFLNLSELQDKANYADYALGWGLGAYQFSRYKKPKYTAAQLYLPDEVIPSVNNLVEAIYAVRDWINTPADDMGPTEFAEVAVKLAKEYEAEITQIIGEDLLKKNYASIYTVGRASDDAPRLIDLRWGNLHHPKITLVGKGVCFDSGGLDLKSSPYMLLMKKDMAGGAHVLGLARMIMQAKLPVCLRVLVPMVENVVSGNAYRPGDIIKSRQGKTIEIGNTDAEGRVILADALTEAVSDQPELIIDLTTLTGAARIALGTDLPAIFSNNDEVCHKIIACGLNKHDLMWRLPLHVPYREYLNSTIADINNNSSEPSAGAITAALFLKDFVPDNIAWVHIDMMAWNVRQRPGRPQGGEAMTLRAIFSFLEESYQA